MKIRQLFNLMLCFSLLLLSSPLTITRAEEDADGYEDPLAYTVPIPTVTVVQAGVIDDVVTVQVFWNMPKDQEADAYGFVVDKEGPAGRGQAAVYYPPIAGFDNLVGGGYYYDEAVNMGETYTYYVKAYDRVGKESAWGKAQITLAGVKITDLKAESESATAKISWKTDYETQGVVEYGLDKNYGKTSAQTDLGFEHSVTITDLQPNKTYHFRIKATVEE